MYIPFPIEPKEEKGTRHLGPFPREPKEQKGEPVIWDQIIKVLMRRGRTEEEDRGDQRDLEHRRVHFK